MAGRILKVSITELLDYQRCGRAWDLQSTNRQSLTKKGKPATALWMGSAIHAALAAQIDGKSPKAALDEYIETMRIEIAQDYLAKVGVPMSSQEWVDFDESAKLCSDVTRNYFRHYGTKATYTPLTPIASEMTFMIPLPIETDNYDEVYLVGTVDALLYNRDGQLWIADHKTFSQKADPRDLQLDHQFVGYCACIQYLTGEKVAGFLYDGINKKVPRVPKLLQSGKLSKEWIDTTAEVYTQAVLDAGQNPHSEEYAGFIARLRERDRTASPFFIRHKIMVSQAAIRDWWENTSLLMEEIAGKPRLTFNRRWEGCWDCNVRDICDAISRGDDVDYVKQGYRIGTYGTQRTLANSVSPATVGSLDDLVSFLANKSE